MKKSHPDYSTGKLIKKVTRASDPFAPRTRDLLDILDASRRHDLVWRLSKKHRRAFVRSLGYALHCAIRDLDDADEALRGHIVSMPETLRRLAPRSPRKSAGAYMFWDLVIVGLEEALRPDGPKHQFYAPIADALARQTFEPSKRMRQCAAHGLYHLAQCSPHYEDAFSIHPR